MNFDLPPHRPRSVTFISWGVFLLAGWNVAKVVALAQQSELLLSLAVRPDPRWRLVIAAGWAVIFAGLGVGLRGKRPFTRRAIPLALTLYVLYELILVSFFAQTPLARQAIWPQVILYAVIIGFSGWGLNRTAVDAYFEIGD